MVISLPTNRAFSLLALTCGLALLIWLHGGCSTTDSNFDLTEFRTAPEDLPLIEFTKSQTRSFSGKYERAAPTVTLPAGIYRASSQWCPNGSPVATLYRAPAKMTVKMPAGETTTELHLEGWLHVSENNGWVGVWLSKYRLPQPLQAPPLEYKSINVESSNTISTE